MKLRAVWYFSKEDEDCSGDYHYLKLYQGRKLIKEWTDYYHDKSSDALAAFIDGVEFATGEKVELSHQNKHLDY